MTYPKKLNRKKLEQAYVGRQLTEQQCADLFGVCRKTIRDNLKAFGLKSNELSDCPYCGESFKPRQPGQVYCPKCRDAATADDRYFDGMRRTAVGFHERECWVCRKTGVKVQAHHVIGRQDDAEEPLLVVLCRGCHQLVTILSRRIFLADPKKMADLLTLARFARRLPNVKTIIDYKEVA